MDSMTLEQAIAYVRGTHTYPASEEDAKVALSLVLSAAEKWAAVKWAMQKNVELVEVTEDELLSAYRKAQEDKHDG